MEIKANEISALIKQQIKKYKHKLELLDTGTVMSIGDGVATVHGLKNAMFGQREYKIDIGSYLMDDAIKQRCR